MLPQNSTTIVLGNWDLTNVTDINNAFTDTNLSVETYSHFLISLAKAYTYETLKDNLVLGPVPSIRLDNETTNEAYTKLTGSVASGGKNMTIYDGDSYTAEELIAFQPNEPYMLEMTSLGQTYTLTNDNMPIHITDSGGVRDPYQSNENYSLLLTGVRSFTLDGTATMEGGYDFVKIYDGIDDSATLLFSSSGSATQPINVQSSGNNIYITLTSDTGYNQPGLHLTVSYPSAIITLNGDNPTYVTKDSVITNYDLSASATYDGNDVSASIVITPTIDSIDTSILGLTYLDYTFTPDTGILVTKRRAVSVYNPPLAICFPKGTPVLTNLGPMLLLKSSIPINIPFMAKKLLPLYKLNLFKNILFALKKIV